MFKVIWRPKNFLRPTSVKAHNKAFFMISVIGMMYSAWSRWELIVDVFPGGTELELPFKTGSWIGCARSQ